MKGSLRVPGKFFVSGPLAVVGDDAKLVAGHLWTGPHATAIGCFRLPTAYLAGDLGWATDRAGAALAELAGVGFIERDERTGWTLIPTFVKTNSIHNAQAAAGAAAALAEVPGGLQLSDRLIEVLQPFRSRIVAAAQRRRGARWNTLAKSKDGFQTSDGSDLGAPAATLHLEEDEHG